MARSERVGESEDWRVDGIQTLHFEEETLLRYCKARLCCIMQTACSWQNPKHKFLKVKIEGDSLCLHACVFVVYVCACAAMCMYECWCSCIMCSCKYASESQRLTLLRQSFKRDAYWLSQNWPTDFRYLCVSTSPHTPLLMFSDNLWCHRGLDKGETTAVQVRSRLS